jgi:hypothetical protein
MLNIRHRRADASAEIGRNQITWLHVTGAVLLPVGIFGAAIAIAQTLQIADWLAAPGAFAWMALAELAGFLFVARRLRLWALPMALVYFPLMYLLLFRVMFVVSCALAIVRKANRRSGTGLRLRACPMNVVALGSEVTERGALK